MNLIEDGKQLLAKHDSLFPLLHQIPKQRKINYREDMENNNLIGKPRFDERRYLWPKDTLVVFHDHLQNLWDYFTTYSHWFGPQTKCTLDRKHRNLSQQSVKFLLERELWATNEVYGAYLIEKTDQTTTISYYRFDNKVKSFSFPKMTYPEREDWIVKDGINQIQNQFSYLWDYIRTEIEVCMDEQHHKYPASIISSSYLIEQLQIAEDCFPSSPEAALLVLGRISEMWLLDALQIDSTWNNHLISLAKVKGLLTKSDALFFSTLRHHYNQLKHSRSYNVQNCPVLEYINKFQYFLSPP